MGAPDNNLVAATLRMDRGRLMAALIARLGDFQLAEDCLQDAVEAALIHWGRSGVPDNPQAWLLRVAQRKAIDRFRRDARSRAYAAELAALEREDDAMAVPHDIPDHRLRLIFTCCHPALERKTRVALTLRTLGGLTTDEIARAFLDKPATMAQRLSRARKKIQTAAIPFTIPDDANLPERVSSVLTVIYLIFNEGYAATEGDAQLRVDLCEEALFLARLMWQLCPDDAEVAGLLALILLTHARRAARMDDTGGYVPLKAQDRGIWDRAAIEEGRGLVEWALAQGRVGRFQLQAAIAALHGEAASAAATDWRQIVALYRLLARMSPEPVVRLNLALARAEVDGAGQALADVDHLEDALSAYQPFHAARAELLARLDHLGEAELAYARAISLTQVRSEQAFLRGQLALVQKKRPSSRLGRSPTGR
ncbi:sigma-70 family RNA polymerase sigma factor [Aliiroseovarius subalbicans]|uniref:RNA polymerase sigma factor n=1 Tax=Aliiroseovarius subalbicans TaxID=2925840 RepID=UPI001F589418|nr:sigma-70 family RNA polymerase sigma factor [Aliiroseovarius subalbicans]MCI2398799.1 sigma-70 family RNA polymerase sigma factor [Aliiroseovarius subalbicans]